MEIKNKLSWIIKRPNKKTLKAIEDAENGKGLTVSKDVKDLFKKLGYNQ